VKYELGDTEAWSFSVRMIYDRSGRTFEMDLNKRFEVDIEDHGGSWVPFGGPAIVIEGNDDTRTCLVAMGLERFVEAFEGAISRFARADLTYASSAETAEEQLQDRNEFLKHASNNYPAILAEISRSLHRLSRQVEEGQVRMASLRPALVR